MRHRYLITSAALVALSSACIGQEATSATSAAPAPVVVAPAAPLLIPRDTPIRLLATSEISTRDRQAGDRFRLRVDEAVLVNGVKVIPIGATAYGELISAQAAGGLGKRGNLTGRLLYVDVGGKELPISGDVRDDGSGGGRETAFAVLAGGLMGLFHRGNNARIKAGERMTAFTAADAWVAAADGAMILVPAPAGK